MKIKAICLLLALGLFMTGCGRRNENNKNDVSDNIVSGGMSDISDGMSDIKEDIKDGASDLNDDLTPGGDHNDSRGDRDHDNIVGNGDNEDDLQSGDGYGSDIFENDIPSAQSELNKEEDVPTGASLSETELLALNNDKKGWGQGVNVDEKNRPVGSLDYQQKYGAYDAYFIGEGEKVIYLTFDEGWENGYTAPILDVLQEKNVPAVFFCTLDYIEKWPDLIKRMIDEGHAVGNHSDNHPSFPDLSVEECRSEVMNVHDYMVSEYGYEMTLFRAPAGEFSERTLAELQMLGYKSVFWSFAYRDWEVNNQMGVDKAFPKVVGALHDGAIYLLHAVSSDNAALLGDFIDEARAQGYEFKLFQ